MNKSYYLLLTFILTYSQLVAAYIPTVESLFRNGNNADIGNQTVVAEFSVERKVTEENASLLKDIPLKTAYKVLIGNENEDRPRFIQIDYRSGVIADETMNKVNYRNVFSLRAMGLNSEQKEAKIFYSLISSLLNNNSTLLMDFLESEKSVIRKNNELVDKEQLALLNSYRYYLKEKKDESKQDSIPNPLKPESDDLRAKVKDILKRGFLTGSPYIKRSFIKSKFYWEVTTPKLFARFDNDTHQLKKFIWTGDEGKFEVDLHNYILFKGNTEFPEVIYIRDFQGYSYEIKMSKIISFKDNSSSFNARLDRYQDTVRENSNKVEEIIKPAFIL